MRRVSNPPNPFAEAHIEWDGPPPPATLEVFEEEAKSALAENDSPDVGFRYSVNPYRGCFHACAYCYARPSHQYLGFGAGTDFERKIVVKTNIATRLREAFDRRAWTGEVVVFSGNTDCYQPLEASYGLTRACLEVCLAYRNPVAVITKSAVIARDVRLLAELAHKADAHVTVSVAFANDAHARAIEPNAASIRKRFEMIKRLTEAGVSTGVSLAPIIPGLNDADIPEVLERAHEAGARSAFIVLVRLPREVLPVFEERLVESFPDRARKVMNAIREMRGGASNEARFGKRMKGDGERWKTIEALFERQLDRLHMKRSEAAPRVASTFRRPTAQLSLF